MKPILACDVDVEKLVYPCMLFPKIDGVRGLNVSDRLVGRSGKQFKNRLNTEFFSDPWFNGFDGEMVVDKITGSEICNVTTSALGTIKGTVETKWCLFDYVVDGVNNHEPYERRYAQLVEKVRDLHHRDPSLRARLWVIPYQVVHNRMQLEAAELAYIEQGYEGLILRDPNGGYKYGRSTVREGNYLRLKRFMDSEFEITGIVQGNTNNNVKKANPNGYAERSTLAENMVPNGMVGTLQGIALETKVFGGRVVLRKGDHIEVSPGKMSHAMRKHYFQNQNELIGETGKFKFFPVGVKDKPRFPTFQGLRDLVDMG